MLSLLIRGRDGPNLILRLVMEEVILIDGQRLNEVILPLMNVSRRTKTGKVDENESLNKSQIYVNFFGRKFTIYSL